MSDLTYSLGMVIAAEGRVSDVLWEGPAFKHGLTVGNQIIAVNGIAFDIEDLRRAVSDASQIGAAIEILIQDGDRFVTIPIEYRGGLRYPHLERDEDKPAYLDEILAARE